MKRIAIFAADGSEDIETVAPIDIFRRAKFHVDVISIERHLDLTLSQRTHIRADLLLADANLDQYDVYYLPGGLGLVDAPPISTANSADPPVTKPAPSSPASASEIGGVNHFRNSRAEVIREYFRAHFNDNSKIFAAICAAPALLYEWGLLTPERRLTCYAGCQTDFEANYVDQPIVQSGNLFTAAGAGLSVDFALTIVAHLANPQLSSQIRSDLQLGQSV